MRHNNRSQDRQLWTDGKLISEAKRLASLIFVMDCFATCDICRYETDCAELERRGFEVVTAAEFRKRGQS